MPSTEVNTGKCEKNVYRIFERDHEYISHWWKTSQILMYFIVFVSGIATSIASGNIWSAFQLQCILNSNMKLKDIQFEIDNSTGKETWPNLKKDNIEVYEWGEFNSCQFCTFAPATSAVFAFIWGALFLNCGKGGRNSHQATQAWRIVPPAFLFTLSLFIMSTVSLSMITSGFLSFCHNIMNNSTNLDVNLTSCSEVFSLNFPWDNYNTQLYENYIIAQTGSALVFFGWFMAVTILLVRCGTRVDFVVVPRVSKPPPLTKEEMISSQEDQDEYTSDSSDSLSEGERTELLLTVDKTCLHKIDASKDDGINETTNSALMRNRRV